MPTENPTLIRTYTFSEDELLQAKLLTTLNKQLLQTLLTQVTEERAKLSFNYELPNPTLAYAQEVRYLQGQIDILIMLLNSSEEAQHQLAHPQNED